MKAILLAAAAFAAAMIGGCSTGMFATNGIIGAGGTVHFLSGHSSLEMPAPEAGNRN